MDLGKQPGSKILLRNEAKRKGGVWIGTCLEFSIVVTAGDIKSLERRMTNAVELYIEGLIRACEKGEDPKIVRVPWYCLRKTWFDLRFTLREHIRVLRRSQFEDDVQLWRKDKERFCC